MFSYEDKVLIKACYLEKGWTAKRLRREFPKKIGHDMEFADLSKKSKIPVVFNF